MDSIRQDTLLYDDGCPMCAFQSRALTWLDWRGVIRVVALSHPQSRTIAPTLTREQLHEAIHVFTPRGRTHRGARAIRRLGLRVSLLVPIGLLLWLPGVIQIAERVYMWISANRHLLSRVFGCEQACAIVPPRQRDGDLGAGDGSDG